MTRRFIFTYLVLFAIQIVLANYLNFGPYFILCWFPAMILCLPVTFSTVSVLLVAFVTAFVADFLTTGTIGITIIPLLVVAYYRNTVIRMVFGSELLSRREDVSIHKQGAAKVSLALLIVSLVYFSIYAVIDAAGTYPALLVLIRIAVSTLVSVPVSLYVVGVLSPREADRWR